MLEANKLPHELTVLEQLILQAPMPTELVIEAAMRTDQMANPHNDSYKPERRSRSEIIIDYKVNYAKEFLARIYLKHN